MKNIVCGLFIIILSMNGYGQTENPTKKIEFGFNLGLNRTNLKLNKIQTFNSPIINNKFGFDLGILISYNPTSWLSILPQAELSFNPVNIQYYSGEPYESFIITTKDKMYPVSLAIKNHFHFRLDRKKNSPYLIIGPSVRFDLENEDNMSTTHFKSRPNVAIDFGVGLDSKLKHFKVSPELVYSYGMMNVNPLIDATYYHKLSLLFNFKD